MAAGYDEVTAPSAPSLDQAIRLVIPAKPEYISLARLALTGLSRVRELDPETLADLKLAITEAANDYVDENIGLEDESRLNFSFHLGDDRLLMDLDGTAGPVNTSEQELSRAIIEATVDEADFSGGRTRLIKYLNETG